MAARSVLMLEEYSRKGAKPQRKPPRSPASFFAPFFAPFAPLRENLPLKLDHSAGARTRASDPPPMTDASDYRDAFGLTGSFR